MPEQNRQLAAILFTDIIGYTAMMQKDEQGALLVTRHYIATLKKSAEAFHGKILNDYGDGSLCCFPSVTEAVKAATQIQQQLQQEPNVPLRIGIHMGELFFEENKVMGDSVNVASRIQSLACANSILFSKEVFDKLKNHPEYKSVSLGKFEFKNVEEPLEIFALASEGLVVPRREQLTGKLKEIKRLSNRRNLFIATAILIILVTAALVIYKKFSATSGFTGEKSIAVLPFENMDKDTSQEYLTDGITQDIINNLSKISSLKKVIGWFSVRSFKKTTKSLKQIADELGVAAVLSGTIQKHDGRMHIIAELIEASTNKRLWGNNFEYEGKDILSIQSEVAGKIVSALKADVTPEEKKSLSKHYAENTEAYKFYLRGRNFWNASGPENFDSAEANFKRAIQLEPDYALAYAGLADCYDVNYRGQSQLERVPIAKLYVEKALSLDSNLSEALTTLGFIQQNFDYDWVNAKMNLEKAILLNPNNSAAHMFYGLVLINSGTDKNKALEEFKKAVDLDPLSYYVNWNYSRNLYFSGKYDLSIQQFNRMRSFIPKQQEFIIDFSIGLIYLKKHEYLNAKEMFDKLPPGNGTQIDDPQIMRSYGYAIIGDTMKAKAIFKETLKKHANLSHYRNSQVYTALGNINEAINELESGYEVRDLHMFWIKVDPAFDPIRNEPRFKELLKKMNLD